MPSGSLRALARAARPCVGAIRVAGSVLALCATLASAWPAPALAAAEQRPFFEYDLLFPKSTEGVTPGAIAVAPEISPPLETPIDPGTYVVVPGDLLQLQVGGETDRAWRLAVTASGRLLLPSAESIDAAGRTLEEVDDLVRRAMAPRFPGKPISLHMLQPGMFRIPITGMIASPGVLLVHAYDRLSFAIGAAGGPLPGGSIRRIEIHHADGRVDEIDMVRFVHSGDLDQNPTVAPGMRIHVPPAGDFVRVTGALRGLAGMERPIVSNVGSRIPESPRMKLEWRQGDTVGSMLTRAGGLSEDATGEIVLVRGSEMLRLRSPEDDSAMVRAGDLIETAVRDRWVYVIGAVRYPGPHGHLPSLTAADYVRIAGGPTELGRGRGWRVQVEGRKSVPIGEEEHIPPGSTVVVPERWTYKVSTLLAPISGITALVISVVALRK